ncbi:MAG: metalloregulator ArsR/SmtB family transcription factor [Candidatus Contubernalis sp.]|nr:metalloregulator ArsR/SmtB family transcription factor [Candidatus Contubernalis sp.]
MDNLLTFLKIISDETRLRIIMLLNKKELCVCEICDILNLSQPKVSRHLTKLRDTGFVKNDREGQWIFYCLNMEDELMKDIVKKIEENIDSFSALKNDKLMLAKKQQKGIMCERQAEKKRNVEAFKKL